MIGGMVMKYIIKGYYIHRNKLINKCPYGWEVENCLNIFKTLNDAKQYINQKCDGTNTKTPEIIGNIYFSDTENKLVYELIK